ncbi:MAG: translation initiation factor IF-2, partial [Candidatus Hydrogenedentes bacterium]|nr:translation initiation factor IF-2 [Candidatus Hydrogenedentota bacterium]
GPVAWVLVQNGKLRTGDVFLSGSTHGRVRTMLNSRGEQIVEAGPSTPVLVTGFSETPNAGDIFVVAADERGARSVAQKRAEIERQKRGPAVKHMTLEDFHARMAGVEKKTLNIIIKADAQGSVDVLQSSFLKLGNEEVSVSVVHSGVGGINSSDVLLASASDAVIIGFHVTANPKVQKLAEEEGVEIRVYLIIYEAIEEVRHALEGLLAPETREVIVGHAEVRQLFKSSAIGTIAGCYQTDGTSERGALARLVRDGVVIHSGKIGSLRRNKDDVRSVNAGFECGIKLERYDDLQPGDIIETYRLESVAKTLS